MPPNRRHCMNQAVETSYWKTSYKLYFYLKRGFGATEQSRPRWAMPPQALFQGSGVTGWWQLHLQLILSGVALDAVSSNSTQYVWSSSKFLNWLRWSVNDKRCMSFLLSFFHTLQLSVHPKICLGFLIKLPLVFCLWTDTSLDTIMKVSLPVLATLSPRQ